MEKKIISVKDIIKNSWNLYIENFQQFLMPILILLILPIIITILDYSNYNDIILTILMITISIFVSLWISILLIDAINKLYHKQTFEISRLYSQAFHKVPSFLWVSFITALAVILGFILLIIPGIIFAIWYNFSTIINVLETKNNKGILALNSSKSLVKGRWWQTFVKLLLPALLVYAIVLIVVAGLTYVLNGGQIDLTNPESGTYIILNSLSTLIFTMLVPLFYTFEIILYNSLKETKKETGLEEI